MGERGDQVASLDDAGGVAEGAVARGSLLALGSRAALGCFLASWQQGSREEGVRSGTKSTLAIDAFLNDVRPHSGRGRAVPG